MAHTGIFATALQCQYKAGVNASTTAIAEAYINAFCTAAESIINVKTRKNWSDAYSGLNADVKGILMDAEASYVGMNIISADMSGYTSSQEAATMLNFLRDCFVRDIEILSDKNMETFIMGA